MLYQRLLLLLVAMLTYSVAYAIDLPANLRISEDGQRFTNTERQEDGFYNIDSLRTIYLDFEDSNWQTQLETNYGTDVLISATLTMNGIKYENVGVRYRGQTSYMKAPSNKKSFKVKMDFDDDAEPRYLSGYNTLNLNNGYEDPSFMRDVLFNRLNGIHCPTLKANYVILVCNGENWGVYSSVQQPNSSFIDQWFIGNGGARWRCEEPDSLATEIGPGGGGPGGGGPGGGKPGDDNSRFGAGTSSLNYLGHDTTEYYKAYTLKNDSRQKDWARLMLMTEKLNKLDPTSPEYYDSLDTYLDIDNALWFLANEIIFADEDGYINKGGMDYYVYYENESNRIVPLQYDANSTFSQAASKWGPFEKSTDTTYALMYRMMKSPEIKQRYLAHFRTIINEVLVSSKIDSLIDYFDGIIRSPLAEDTHKIYTMAQYTTDLATLKSFVTTRKTNLLSNAIINVETPQITEAYYTSGNGINNSPEPNETVTIIAKATATAGIEKMTLYYSDDLTDRFNHITMTKGDNNNYSAEIPGMTAGKYVRWYIEAIAADNANTAAYLPVGAEHDVFIYHIEPKIAASSKIVINEIMASNGETIADPQGDYDDWTELFNTTDQDIDMSGMYISDKDDNLMKFEIPEGTTIPANGYLLIWNDEDSSDNPDGLHCNFKLSASGEELFLVDTDGVTILEQLTFGEQEKDVAWGRYPNGTGDFTFLPPTPNAYNATPVNVEEEYTTDHNMVIYPNPTDNTATLQIYLEKAGYASITLFSSTGQEYGELENNYYNAGMTELSFSFKSRFNLTTGVYFIRIASEHSIETIPLIIN